MSANLCEQYNELVNYMTPLHNLASSIHKKTKPGYLRLVVLWRIQQKLDGSIASRASDALLGKMTPELRQLIIKETSEDEKKSEFFGLCTSEFRLHTISEHLQDRFPSFDFERLHTFHKQRESLDTKAEAKKIFGIVIAATLWFFKDFPQAVINKWFGISVLRYQQVVFVLAVIALLYFTIGYFLTKHLFAEFDERHKFVGRILQYTALSRGEMSRAAKA